MANPDPRPPESMPGPEDIVEAKKVLLHSLANHPTPPARIPLRTGYVPLETMRKIQFGVTSLGIFALALDVILGIWEVIEAETAWRVAPTIGVLLVTLALFAAINEYFGPVKWVDPREDAPP